MYMKSKDIENESTFMRWLLTIFSNLEIKYFHVIRTPIFISPTQASLLCANSFFSMPTRMSETLKLYIIPTPN